MKDKKIIVIDDVKKQYYLADTNESIVSTTQNQPTYRHMKCNEKGYEILSVLEAQGYKKTLLPGNLLEVTKSWSSVPKSHFKNLRKQKNHNILHPNNNWHFYVHDSITKYNYDVKGYDPKEKLIIEDYVNSIKGLGINSTLPNTNYPCIPFLSKKANQPREYTAYITNNIIYIVPKNSFANKVFIDRSSKTKEVERLYSYSTLHRIYAKTRESYYYNYNHPHYKKINHQSILFLDVINVTKKSIANSNNNSNNHLPKSKPNLSKTNTSAFSFYTNDNSNQDLLFTKVQNPAIALLSYFDKIYPQWNNSCSDENGFFNRNMAKAFFKRTIHDLSQIEYVINIAQIIFDWKKTKSIFRFSLPVLKLALNTSDHILINRCSSEFCNLLFDSFYIQLTGLLYQNKQVEGAFFDIDNKDRIGYIAVVINSESSYSICRIQQFKLSDISISSLIDSLSETGNREFYYSLFKLLICLYESSSNRLFRVQNDFKTVSETSENSVNKNNLFESIYVQFDQDVWNHITNDNSEKRTSHNNDSDKPIRTPHIRMGHLHTYWIGSKKDNTRKTIIKYVRATMVKGNNAEYDLPVSINTIRLYSK